MHALGRLVDWVARRTTPWWRFVTWLVGSTTAVVLLGAAFPGASASGLEVAALGAAFFVAWIPLIVLFFAGLASDYTQRGRLITGLALAAAPWTLRRARWPSFTTSVAVFVALCALAGNTAVAAIDAVPGLADRPALGLLSLSMLGAACALLAGLAGSAGAPRGAALDGASLLLDRWPFFRSLELASIVHAAVSSDGNALCVRLRDGTLVSVPLDSDRAPDAADLVVTIRERVADRWLEPEPDPTRWAILDRAGDSLVAWQKRLAALARGADYRERALGKDDLVRVLRAPDTLPERRIAAAIALRATGDTAEIERQRAAAPTPRMRVALEAVEHDALELAQIDAAIAQERGRG